MFLILAPMEGVVDHFVRDILTRAGGYDLCVTEFIRVTQSVLPKRVFLRYCPELENGGKTRAGVPVFVQLLGSDLEFMAENARQAAECGALGIDLNFGCPSKKVNQHEGGCILLDRPQKIHQIVRAVRQAVPLSIPVTAKIRLGISDPSLVLENAKAIEDAGASRLAVHARTKNDGYRPPARWEWIARIREHISIPVVANGDIATLKQYLDCKQTTGCSHFMIGRGAMASPELGKEIASWEQGKHLPQEGWPSVCKYICELYEITGGEEPTLYLVSRMKQWLNLIRQFHPSAVELFEEMKQEKTAEQFYQKLRDVPEFQKFLAQSR